MLPPLKPRGLDGLKGALLTDDVLVWPSFFLLTPG